MWHLPLVLVAVVGCMPPLDRQPPCGADQPAPAEGGLPDGLGADLPDGPRADLPDGPKTDLAPFDTLPPTGGPCPCTAPLLCIQDVCRATCTAPTDPCQAIADCPSDHGCVPSADYPGVWLCLPAVATGQPCSKTAWCAVDHVCYSVSGSSVCLPTCSPKGAACGTSGGTCLDVSGCLVCSSP